MTFNIPYNQNEKLRKVVEFIDEDAEIRQYMDCANVTAIDRLSYNDHGYTHSKIVSNIALKMLRILSKNSVIPNIVKDYKLTEEEAEVVVVLASVLHDIGMAIHRKNHVEYGIALGFYLLNKILADVYPEKERAIIVSETLHAMSAHELGIEPLTMESGIVTIADALDMAGGRARIPFSKGKVDIHSVSAMAIDSVEIQEGKGEEPLQIKIKMGNSAGIFQIDELLKGRVEKSGLKDYIRIEAEITGEAEKSIVKKIEI